MSYHTVDFLLLFLPLVIGAHYITPQKHRWKILLAARVVFVARQGVAFRRARCAAGIFYSSSGMTLPWNIR